MKKKNYAILLIVVILSFGVIRWLGIGYYSSGSAILDLEEELKGLHGEPYTGREVENGTEDMEFSIKPDTFFLTNYSLRDFWGLDYRYRCEVIYTTHSGEKIDSVRKISYVGIDPMGHGKEEMRAYLEREG